MDLALSLLCSLQQIDENRRCHRDPLESHQYSHLFNLKTSEKV